MGFLQIISFATDRLDDFIAVEREWERASAGRRTGSGGQLFADRDRPGHYVAIDWFDSYESAMVNSHLPETDTMARGATALATEAPVFWNLEPADRAWCPGEDALRTSLETSTAAADTFADDVDLDLLVPHGRMRTSGIVELEQALRDEAPGRDIERWDVLPIAAGGFVVEYAYRTHAHPSLVTGIMVVTLRDGLIDRLAITCAGNWSPETEARVVEETGALGPRTAEVVA
jgi:hypothetical protein